jgi:hypothetical protein
MPLVSRFFSFDDLTPERGWALLDWCRTHGATEFTLAAFVSPTESQRMKDFFAVLDRYQLPRAPRRLLTASPGEPRTRDVSLWQLTADTEHLLKAGWSPGFVSRDYDEDLWLQDSAVYRDGELMMGVLSHENGGVLRVTELELADLRRTGFPDRDSVPWVGF